ncbi:MAG: hypothetical protein L0215_13955 [Gemmataceae bacterium]|nr:hypothetical protein [Gemmataceae bacterium]
MTAGQLAAIANGLLPFAAGLYLTLAGYGLFGKGASSDPLEQLQWEKKSQNYRTWGPALMLVGIGLAIVGYLGTS